MEGVGDYRDIWYEFYAKLNYWYKMNPESLNWDTLFALANKYHRNAMEFEDWYDKESQK